MKTEFRLRGLSRPQSATCEPLYREGFFNAPVEMTPDRFDALWDYCEDHWSNRPTVMIEHDGLTEDGTPINPKVISLVHS